MPEILVRPQQLIAIADRVSQGARRIQIAVDEVDRSIYQLNAAKFEGNRSELLMMRYRRVKNRLGNFKTVLDHFANDLYSTAAAFEKADHR